MNTHPPATDDELDVRRAPRPGIALFAVLAFFAAGLLGLLAPSAVASQPMEGMYSMHYMELLMLNQPWNLLLFMALPVVLAETLAITELVILLGRAPGWVHTLSRAAGLLAGPVLFGILVHLLRHVVIPLSRDGGWRGWADVVAVAAYLLGSVPLGIITLVEAGLLGRTARDARRLHVVGVAGFLVVSHVAMILGMLDPTVTGWKAPAAHDMSNMPGMSMPSSDPSASASSGSPSAVPSSTPGSTASSMPSTTMPSMTMDGTAMPGTSSTLPGTHTMPTASPTTTDR